MNLIGILIRVRTLVSIRRKRIMMTKVKKKLLCSYLPSLSFPAGAMVRKAINRCHAS